MTDNAVTDADLQVVYTWLNDGYGEDTPIKRVLRAYLPTPPATLADELRDICKKYSGDVEVDLEPLADRVEAVVKERNVLQDVVDESADDLQQRDDEIESLNTEVDRLTRDLESQALLNKLKQGHVNAARAERDEFQNEMISSERKQAKLEAEVERLTRERLDRNPETKARVEDALAHLERAATVTVKTPTLPDPADVPDGEMWLIHTQDGQAMAGVRNSGGNWSVLAHNGFAREDDLNDEEVTLVTRLVPEPRVETDPDELDKLPEGSVILCCKDVAQKALVNGWTRWEFIGDGAGSMLSPSAISCGPVIVLWEPEVSE